MPAGRKPKPLEQREREDSVRARYARPTPKADRVRPVAPDGLSADAIGAWNDIVAALELVGTLHSADRTLIEAAACSLGLVREARRSVEANGLSLKGERGAVINPAVRIELSALSTFRLAAAELGIGPVGRTRLGIVQTPATTAAAVEEELGPSPRLKRVK